MTDFSDLKQDYHDTHEICSVGWDNYLSQATVDLDYYFRAQHTEDEAKRAELQGRELYTIDKIGRQVNLLSGYEIRNRHILKIIPTGSPEMVEDTACGQHTKVIMNLMSRHDGYHVLSEAFKWGTLVQGSNLIEIWRDRNGNLQFSRLGWNQFLLNPSLTKPDLTDCKDILIGRWIDDDKVKFLLPTSADKIDDIKPLTMSSRWSFLGNPILGNKAKQRLYEEWWRRETEYKEMVISRRTGQQISLVDFANQYYNGDKKFAKQRIAELRLEDGSPALSRFSTPIDRVKLTIFVDEEPVWDGDNPLKADDYNFVWVHGDFCAECPRDELKLQGFVRKLRDPQRALNRRTNQIYDLIESQIQGARVIRDKHITNVEDAYRTGQGVVLHLTEACPDELPMEQIFRQFPASEVPQSLFAALEMTDKAETDTGGLNQEIFGSDDKDNVPAILGRFRTGQALTGQAGMFEGFRQAKKHFGMKLVRLIQLNYPADKVASIINEYPSNGFYNRELSHYDCMAVEGLQTESQQELFYLELKALRAEFQDAQGILPLSEIIKYCPTPFKAELIAMVKRAEQSQMSTAQQAQDAAMRQNRLTDAFTATQVARAVEDSANAEQSRADAQLTRAKTVTEINKMQDDTLVDMIKESVKLEMAKIAAKERNGRQTGTKTGGR